MAHEQPNRWPLEHTVVRPHGARHRQMRFRLGRDLVALWLGCVIIIAAAADELNEIKASGGGVNNGVVAVEYTGDAAQPAPDEPAPEMNLSLAELLASPDEELQPEGERCLRGLNQHHATILDDSHLLFRGLGKRFWLNRLRGRCHGMRSDMVLITERRGSSRQCEFDTVYATSRSRLGAPGIQSVRCFLGKFEPVTADHAAVLKVAFEQQRRDLRRRQRAERRQRRAAKHGEKQPQPQTETEAENDSSAAGASDEAMPVENTHG